MVLKPWRKEAFLSISLVVVTSKALPASSDKEEKIHPPITIFRPPKDDTYFYYTEVRLEQNKSQG
jgi:hypothetical protein